MRMDEVASGVKYRINENSKSSNFESSNSIIAKLTILKS